MKKILITGGAGFIGTHLASHLLERGCHVDLLDDFSRGVRDSALAAIESHAEARFLERNMLAPGALDDLDDDYHQVFHLAAIIGVEIVRDRPFEVLRDNNTMLVAALELAARQRALERFVFTSTSEVYAGTLEAFELPIPTPESTPLALTPLHRPRTSYMQSKLYGEALCLHSGLPVTIVRPHNFYGPRMGMAHVVPQLLQKAHRAPVGAGIDVFSVDHRRTFCYIDDAVRMLALLADAAGAIGEICNVGSRDQEIAIGDLARVVLDTVDRSQSVVPQPATDGSPTRRCPDMTKTLGIIEFAAFTSLQEGVKRTWDWYRDNVFEGDEVCADEPT